MENGNDEADGFKSSKPEVDPTTGTVSWDIKYKANYALIFKTFGNLVKDYKTFITHDEVKKDIIVLNKTTKNEVVKIKLEETIKNLLNQLGKNDKVTNDHIVNLLQYCDLLEELKQVNGKR